MPAGLETYKDMASFVSARLDAWHLMGTVLDHCFTAEEALEHAHLRNWNVRKEALLTATGLHLTGQYGLVRDNPYTHEPEVIPNGKAVGRIYTPIQNEDHIGFMNALVDQSGAIFETAGSLHGGRDVFVTMKLPECMLIGGVDAVAIYIAALNNHSGDNAYRLLTTPTRIVCANTQAAAIRGAKRIFKIRHTVNASQHVQEAREALGLSWKYLDGFQAEADMLIDQAYTDAEFDALVTGLLPKVDESSSARALTWNTTAKDALMRSFVESPTNENIRGTKWCAYQAVTEWTDHFYPVRGDADGDKRALRTLEGRNDRMKEHAWAVLTGAAR